MEKGTCLWKSEIYEPNDLKRKFNIEEHVEKNRKNV